MGAATLLKVIGTTLLAAIPLARHRVHLRVASTGMGILFCGPGVVVALWYLVKVRPGVAAAESGRIT